MTEEQIQGAALIATLVAVPLVSWGADGGPGAATAAGGLLIALAMVTLAALHFIDIDSEESS